MDYFIEGTYSEDSNEAQGEWCEDIEAALYSVVHHSEETYDSNISNLNESYVTQRNKANRWEPLRTIEDSVNPENYIACSKNTPNIQGLDHIPIAYNSITSLSTDMYGKEHNKKGQNLKRAWKYPNNQKPWNIQDRIRNNYFMNRNLVPVHVQRNQITSQNYGDSQEFLKFGGFESFDNVRSNFIANANFSREGNKFNGEHVNCHENLPGPAKNWCENPGNRKKVINGDQNNLLCSENLANHHGANINAKQGRNSSAKAAEMLNTRIQVTRIVAKESEINCEKQSILSLNESTTHYVNISRENVSDEIVIVSDSDENDSDHSSIVEVSIPPKPEPPVIALDSSDEMESKIVSDAKPVLNVSLNPRKASEFTVENSNFGQSSKGNSKCIKDTLLSESGSSKEIKKKKKKKKKKEKCFKEVECNTWTSGMVQFYNKSWGGETYDHIKLQREMTSNPTKWKILDIDKYGPITNYGPLARVRCANCHQFGHLAKHCPDPRKIKCCAMCGGRGHGENQCPNKMCLKCGRPAPLINEGCPACWKNEHPKSCTTCGANDHFHWLCPDAWRKFHSITTTDELEMGTWQEAQYKSPKKLACCFCAGSGHTAAKCHFYTKQKSNLPIDTQPMNIFATLNLLSKKRKKKRRSYFDERNNQHEFNRKRRKTS